MARIKRKAPLVALTATGVALVAIAVYTLSGPEYTVESGPFAQDTHCTRVVDGLPAELMGMKRDSLKGAGVAGWGDGSIVLRCGVEPLAPTINTCMNVNGTDWVLDEERAEREGVRVLTTYGRVPAVEIAFAQSNQSAGDALIAIDRSVRAIPQRSKCIGLGDT